MAAAARDRYGPALEDAVPGEATVLLRFGAPPPGLAEIASVVGRLGDAPPATGQGRLIRIPVRYDGPDLASVAMKLGLDVAEVIELHSQCEYRAAFIGFAPGFAYLNGLRPELHLARRAQPRPRVPGGSVAIASTYTAIYPASAPGGWHLIGRTDAVLFDPCSDRPALLAAGTRVIFESQ